MDIPNLSEVKELNRGYVKYFNEKLGRTPNMYAAMMHSENALSAYYPFHIRKNSLSIRESEAITLVVSQQNNAMYCLSAHTMIGKLNGFTEQEIILLRKGEAPFDRRLDVLVQLVKDIVEKKGAVETDKLNNFFHAGFTYENLIDTLHVVGDNFITNFTGKVLKVPIDFPLTNEL
ncbi:carboxymuconolactone decarboxylase family protein [Algoriphagus resistens]|uniref:carboxymuconolactone decarboxylase family protein n=1 Tax=Algoriphagus resistens TaxID=1750590 RepID=UPI000716B21D|nr:carboxymuconolactone decarboxylase family protein [Algoriphagus resistens]